MSKSSKAPKPAALLLTPGAGGNREHHTLVAIEEALDLPVIRFDFPYRREGRKAPDRAPKLIAAIVDEVERICADLGIESRQLLLGGRSMGGRICSMAVAEGVEAAGLVLLSYPLHPPGKPDRLRVEHWPALDLPCLFVGGDRDPFGSPAEFEAHMGAIPGDVKNVWIEGGRHDMKSDDEQIVGAVVSWVGERWGRRPRG